MEFNLNYNESFVASNPFSQTSNLNDLEKEYKEKEALLKKYISEKLANYRETYDEAVKHEKKLLEEKLTELNNEYKNASAEELADKKYVKKYDDNLKGVKIVTKRAIVKLTREYKETVHQLKFEYLNLYNEYVRIKQENESKLSFIDKLAYTKANFKATFSLKEKITDKKMWFNLLPLGFLLLLIGFYFISCTVNEFAPGIDYIITYGVYTAIVATGAVFIYSMGAFDMSLGNASLMCAGLTCIMYNFTGSIWLALLISVILGMLLGIINAILANMLDLPVMVMTLTMMNILAAIFEFLGTSQDIGYFLADESVSQYASVAIKWIILISFVLLCFVIFNYTKQGRRNKMVGSNETSAKFTGVSIMKTGIISFAISGIGMGLAGFLYLVENGNVQTTGANALSSVGLNVIIAIVFGGMPTSGGPRSKISAAVIGAFFCIILDRVFAAWNIADYRFLAKGLLFLIVVTTTSWNQRSKMLTQ